VSQAQVQARWNRKQLIAMTTATPDGSEYARLLNPFKIGRVHTHLVVTCVTLPNIGPISLNDHFTSESCFAENLISLA
jgi:hypothetical protein